MFKEITLFTISKAIWFCLSLAIASIVAGLVISIIVAVRLSATEAMTLTLPWETIGVLSPLVILLFREAERNRKWFIELLDRLRDDIREKRALKLVESIEDGSARDTAQMQLALSLTASRT
jgi:flagellar biosynthesis protein FliQ